MEKQIAIVLITHLRKMKSDDPFEQIMGSTGMTGIADAAWVMKRGRCDSEATLLITGRDTEEREIASSSTKSRASGLV